MKYSRLRLPWKRLEKGQGFFVPCLDLEKMQEHGLKQAVSERRFDARARPGIVDGFIGVWFFRNPSSASPPLTAAAPSPHNES